jgi:ATP-dependent DNA helicase RecG
MEKAILAKSVTEESKRLRKKVFPEYEIGELHGKMTPKKKDEVMRDFVEGTIDILVTTSVVEVGVNVPNATVIIIEGAERFGLAQLHQLRGRVVRSNHQAYCFVFTDSSSDKTFKRLSALKDAQNGFELAEYDLELRGAGDLYGRKQSGISDIGMDAIKNIKMVEAARAEAQNIIEEDPELKKHPLLEKRVRSLVALHME